MIDIKKYIENFAGIGDINNIEGGALGRETVPANSGQPPVEKNNTGSAITMVVLIIVGIIIGIPLLISLIWLIVASFNYLVKYFKKSKILGDSSA
jgi:hypothetical protein